MGTRTPVAQGVIVEPHAPSYYAATAQPFSSQPRLEGDLTADVVVIGGGFTGLSAALSAAEAGFSVVLLEARQVGWGASGRNGGQMIPGLNKSPGELAAMIGRERARAVYDCALAARASVLGRIERHSIDCDVTHGHLNAARKPAHLDDMKRELDEMAALFDYDSARIVPANEIGAYVSSPLYHGGYFDAAGGHLHPLNYALGLARAAIDAGVLIFEGSAVTALRHAAPVRAECQGGSVTARFGVLACDAFMGDLEPQLGRMTMPVGNYNVATAPLGAVEAASLIPSGAAVSDSNFVLNYYRLSADNRLIFGGGEKYSPRPPADIERFVRPYLEQVFPQLAGIGIDYGWGGIVGVTLSRLPQFGRRDDCFFAHGYSGLGVLLSTLAGELITEAMRGTADRFDLFAALPARPFPGGLLLRNPLYVLGMLYYAMRDRL